MIERANQNGIATRISTTLRRFIDNPSCVISTPALCDREMTSPTGERSNIDTREDCVWCTLSESLNGLDRDRQLLRHGWQAYDPHAASPSQAERPICQTIAI